MSRYVARRLLQVIPVLIGATFLLFALVYAIPTNPAQRLAGERKADPAVVERINREYHLDDPLVVQYGKYMERLAHGDLGKSYTGRPVKDVIKQALPITLRLTAVAFLCEAIIGGGAGLIAGLKRGKPIDLAVLMATLVAISIPIFVLGFTLQLILGVKMGILPVAGVGGFKSYLLPGFILGSVSMAYVGRLTRTTLVESLRADYVRTARAKGLPERRVIGIHALRNSLIPVITFLGADLGALMGGAVVTESIFNIPGIGGAIADGVRNGERTTIVGIVTGLVLVFILANLLVDVLYAVLDPRIRYE
jgi:peptide/nickel transport system permease protein/oligopeptide transport system permease protein